MTRRGMIPRQANLPGVPVWNPGESLFSTLKFEYLSEISTKIEFFLTHWWVTQTGSNEEKNWRSKISLDCPFKNPVLVLTFMDRFTKCWKAYRKMTCFSKLLLKQNNPYIFSQKYPNKKKNSIEHCKMKVTVVSGAKANICGKYSKVCLVIWFYWNLDVLKRKCF